MALREKCSSAAAGIPLRLENSSKTGPNACTVITQPLADEAQSLVVICAVLQGTAAAQAQLQAETAKRNRPSLRKTPGTSTRYIRDEFQAIPQASIDNAVRSFDKRRLAECLARSGGRVSA